MVTIMVKFLRNKLGRVIKIYRWTLFLWFFTFVIVLPFLAQKWVFSPYFYSSENYEIKAYDQIDILNNNRFHEAQTYLSSLNYAENRHLHLSALRNTKQLPRMVAIVIAKKRSAECNLNLNCEPQYLQQTIGALDREVKSLAGRKLNADFVPIIICNVDPDWQEFRDFEMIKDAFPVLYRYKVKPNSTDASNSNRRTQESSDYAFCLEAGLNTETLTSNQNRSQNSTPPKYILILEDDAIAFPNFLADLFYTLDFRVEKVLLQGEWKSRNQKEWASLKLYFPEVWAGFGTDLTTLLELGCISVIGAQIGILLRLVFAIRRENNLKNLSSFGILSGCYSVLVAVIISRQNLLELRRAGSYFLNVGHAPGCCTPAVVYPTKLIPMMVEYLRSPYCEKCNKGVDLALDDFTDNSGFVSYLIQPNLVRHIGLYSTVSSRKAAVPMLFHDLLYD